jgi:hypothetical protein
MHEQILKGMLDFQTLQSLVIILFALLLGIGQYLIEYRFEHPKALQEILVDTRFVTLRRVFFFLIASGLGVMWVVSIQQLIFLRIMNSSSAGVQQVNTWISISFLIFGLPIAISLLAVFKKKFSRAAYLVYSIYLLPAFILILFSAYLKRAQKNTRRIFPLPPNTTIILWTVATSLFIITSQYVSNLILLSQSQREMETSKLNEEQMEIEAIGLDREMSEAEAAIVDVTFSYTETWQKSADKRTISVNVSLQSQSEVTIEKNGAIAVHQFFSYPSDAFLSIAERLQSNDFQSLKNFYCDSPGKCLNDSAMYTISAVTSGETKTVTWGHGDPQIENTLLNSLTSRILRDIPIDIYE